MMKYLAHGRQRGVSLVEIMIGVTIALVLTLGLLVLIERTSRSFQSQDDFARLQESGVSALSYLGEAIAHTGFFGIGTATTQVDAVAGGVNTVTDCGSAANPPAANWALNAAVPMIGFANLVPADVNATLPCVLATNFQAGPVLAVRMAVGAPLPDPNNNGNLTDAAFVADRIYVQGNSTGAILFRGDGYGALRGAGAHRTLFGGADAPIFEYQAYVHYIRPCSRPATPPGCAAGDDGGFPIPTLVRQQLDGADMREVALAQGIERINFLYGVDDDGNGVPDRFTEAPANAADWAAVVVVRVSVLVRDARPSAGYDDTGRQYDLNGDGVPDFTCVANVNCGFRRHVFSRNFQVRNIAQRRGG
jgi:type IV pilus assembly protein PilW